MASNIKIAEAQRNAMLDAITTAVGASGLLKIYADTQPTNVGTAIGAQTLLGTLPLSATFAPAASGGVLTANAITQDSSADNSGDATWYSLQTSGGTRIVEGSIGASGADLNLNTITITAGGPIVVSSFTYTAPGG